VRREIQPQSLQGQVHVADKKYQRSDQGAHAPNEDRDDYTCDLEPEQGSAEQTDHQHGHQEHATGCQGDAGSQDSRPLGKNSQLGVANLEFIALGYFTLICDQPRTIDDPRKPIGHAQQQQPYSRDQNHWTNRQLQRRDQRLK